MNHAHTTHEKPASFWSSRYAIGFIVFGAVAGYYVLTEHRAHFFGTLPYLLLLACPLMHVFMHGGHGGHGHHADHDSSKSDMGKPDHMKPGDRS